MTDILFDMNATPIPVIPVFLDNFDILTPL